MGLTVTLVNGPRLSGKSTVIREMVAECCPTRPHYLRLTRSGGKKKRPLCPAPSDDCGVASAGWLHYDPARVFEVLPERLEAIRREDRYGHVLLESDTDASLWHAYPYSARVFVMAAPESEEQVFRTPSQAAELMCSVLDDSSEFAAEMFGLSGEAGPIDDEGHEDRASLTPAQLAGFLNSPLGNELAIRMHLQPEYRGLVESDVVLINTAVGATTTVVDDVRHRIEGMLRRMQNGGDRDVHVFGCDPLDREDPLRERFLATLRAIAGTTAER